MIFIWGTRVFRKKNGIVADFCPICRRLVFADLEEIRRQSHIYYIGLGSGTVAGHACRCQTCQSEWAVQAGTITGSIHPSSYTTMDSLIEQTFPRFNVVYGERLQDEMTIRRDPFALSPEKRMRLIAEPFFVLDNDVQNQGKHNSWESGLSAFGCLGSLAMTITTIVFFADGEPLVGILLLCLTLGLGWFTYKLSNAGTRKFMLQRIYPRLASCLAPLRPTHEELTLALAHVNSKCAKQTDLKDLLPLLEDARSLKPGHVVTGPPPRLNY